MPTCPVKYCHYQFEKKRAAIGNDKNITFHRLPKDSNRRKQWIINLGLDEKRVTDNTLICSQHFGAEMFDRTSLSCIRLRQNAVPKVVECPASEPGSSRKLESNSEGVFCDEIMGPNEDLKRILMNNEIHGTVNLQTSQYNAETSTTEAPVDRKDLCNRSTCVTPIRLVNSPIKTLFKRTIEQQRAKYCKKIKILEQSCRLKDKRIAHCQNIIKLLRNKRFIDEEQLQMLSNFGMYHGELHKQSINKERKKSINCISNTYVRFIFILIPNILWKFHSHIPAIEISAFLFI